MASTKRTRPVSVAAVDDPGALPTVGVVVLNWNAPHLTAACLDALEETDYPSERLQLVCVDNGSLDGSVALLRRRFPHLDLRCNGANLGFAEGCNRAMRDLDGVDAVALVNNDAVVDPGWLRPLVAALGDPSVGAVAPKMLLAGDYVEIPLDAPVGSVVEQVEVDGADVTDRCLPGEAVDVVPDRVVPLEVHLRAGADATVVVPAAPGASRLSVRLRTPDGRDVEVSAEVRERHRRINNLGTGLTEHFEGYELRHGDRDSDDLESGETVTGFCGGAVLLRRELLCDVGFFDPRFFAYYEDTDLSWRARRRGWRIVTAPESVIHHQLGASGGRRLGKLFFFLNYRNFLLTALRNGDRSQRRAAFGLARHLWFGTFRWNVFGTLRRARRPDLRGTTNWFRVARGVAVAAPTTLRHRRRRVGAQAVEAVSLGGLPVPTPRQPAPREGRLLVYLEVTETLGHPWRSGIQRVVVELLANLWGTDVGVDVVPVTWSEIDGAYRQATAAEVAGLLDAAPSGSTAVASSPPPEGGWQRRAADAVRRTVAGPSLDRWRRSVARARPRDGARDLVLGGWAAGAVFLDADATWNPGSPPRAALHRELRAAGVSVVVLHHDVLPAERPEWFHPTLPGRFTEHLRATFDGADLVICNSASTRDRLERLARAHRPGWDTPTVVVPLAGSSGTPPEPPPSPAGEQPPTLLVVGTLEPRKNHSLALDVWERLLADHPDLELVLVGRRGWHDDDLVARIERLSALRPGLVWRSDVGDEELDELYRVATCVLVPSFDEGYGLPVVEALARGAVVLAADAGGLREVGGDAVELLAPDDVDAWVRAIAKHLDDPGHHDAAKQRAGARTARTWVDVAADVATALWELRSAPPEGGDVEEQVVEDPGPHP